MKRRSSLLEGLDLVGLVLTFSPVSTSKYFKDYYYCYYYHHRNFFFFNKHFPVYCVKGQQF